MARYREEMDAILNGMKKAEEPCIDLSATLQHSGTEALINSFFFPSLPISCIVVFRRASRLS